MKRNKYAGRFSVEKANDIWAVVETFNGKRRVAYVDTERPTRGDARKVRQTMQYWADAHKSGIQYAVVRYRADQE